MNSNLPEGQTQSSRERKFFSHIPKSLIRALYLVYKADFDMFDYGTVKNFMKYSRVPKEA